MPLPADGVNGRWVLASGADTKFLSVALDGTLYCYATPAGTTDRLFKSTDGGLSWATVGGVKDAIIVIVAAPFNAATVYYATTSCVYRSTDAGISFVALPPNPGGAGNGNVRISSLDVVRPAAGNLVAVATTDADPNQYGGVYLLDESTFTGMWENTSIGSYDVLHVAFSPAYANDRTLFAVTTDETETVVSARVGNGSWGQTVGDARLPGIVSVAAMVAFPSDYQPQSSLYVSVDTGVNQGDVYRMAPQPVPGSSIMTRLAIGAGEGLGGVDIASVVCTGQAGSTNVIAGCARQARIYVSAGAGMQWTPSQKPPSGQTEVWLAASGGGSQQMVYVVTSGVESAFSISADSGMTWNQTALIDTKISRLVDFAAISEPNQSETLFLLTHNVDSAKRSVWRSQDCGAHWQRVFSAGLPGANDISGIGGTADGTLFLAGNTSGTPAIWLSPDRGQTFGLRVSPCQVVGWTLLNRNTFFVHGYDGVNGLVYRTDNGGLLYTEPTRLGSVSIASIVLSPSYAQDRTLVVGNMTGEVFVSTDSGASFTQVGQKLPVSNGVGAVSVAFDCDFLNNGNIYAAVDTKTTTTSRERVFRFSIGGSNAWQSIAAELPQDAIMKQMCMTESCILYVVNSQPVAAASGKGGITRCINPALSIQSWETITSGLDDGAALKGLWRTGNQLWSTDTKNVALMTLADNLSTPVVLVSPKDGTSGADTSITLNWQGIGGATEYEWQLDTETGFGTLPSGHTGVTSSHSVRVSALDPSETYYWRVRATRPFTSPWSSVGSFTTLVGGEGVTPVLSLPEPGALTTLAPVFQWVPVTGADRYELLVAAENTFANPVVARAGDTALRANAWQCETSLAYNTTYFWKVRGCTATNFGDWSGVSTFTTESESAPPAQPTDPPEPVISTQTIIPSIITQPAPQITIVTPQTQSIPPSVPVTVQITVPNSVTIVALALLFAIVILLTALLVAFIRRRP